MSFRFIRRDRCLMSPQLADALKQIMALANDGFHHLEREGGPIEEDGLAALRSHWKKPNGRLTPAGVRERARCQKAGMSGRKIAERMQIDESAARYVPAKLK